VATADGPLTAPLYILDAFFNASSETVALVGSWFGDPSAPVFKGETMIMASLVTGVLVLAHLIYMRFWPEVYVSLPRIAIFWLSLVLALVWLAVDRESRPFRPWVALIAWAIVALVARYRRSPPEPAISGTAPFLERGIGRIGFWLMLFEVFFLVVRGFVFLLALTCLLQLAFTYSIWFLVFAFGAAYACAFIGSLWRVAAAAGILSSGRSCWAIVLQGEFFWRVARQCLPSVSASFPIGGWAWFHTILSCLLPLLGKTLAWIPFFCCVVNCLKRSLNDVPTDLPVERVIREFGKLPEQDPLRGRYRSWEIALPLSANCLIFIVIASIGSLVLTEDGGIGTGQAIFIMAAMELALTHGLFGDLAAISFAAAVESRRKDPDLASGAQ
jgi:hypothetical protein